MNARRRHPSRSAVLVLIAAASLVAAPSALAVTATETKAPAAKTAAKTAAAAAKEEKTSAAERRAAESSFERESLDQEAFAAGEAKAEKKSSNGGSFIRGVFGLIIVIGAIFGVQWLLKKWGQAKMDGIGGATGLIDVVATTGLSAGRTLHLVRVADELVLVGATEHSISRLGEFDARQLVGDPADANATFALPSATRRVLPAAGGSTPANDFHGLLEGSLAGPGATASAAAAKPAEAEGSFLHRFLHNLRMQTAR